LCECITLCDSDTVRGSVQIAGVRPPSGRSRRFRAGADATPADTADGQEIVSVLAEPFQSRYTEDASFIGQYGGRQRRQLDQPILEERWKPTSAVVS